MDNPKVIPLGLSLRDYFAGIALQGILANPTIYPAVMTKPVSSYVEMAYVFADSMLEQREETP